MQFQISILKRHIKDWEFEIEDKDLDITDLQLEKIHVPFFNPLPHRRAIFVCQLKYTEPHF